MVSIQVGANVQATLYQDNSLQGRAETFAGQRQQPGRQPHRAKDGFFAAGPNPRRHTQHTRFGLAGGQRRHPGGCRADPGLDGRRRGGRVPGPPAAGRQSRCAPCPGSRRSSGCRAGLAPGSYTWQVRGRNGAAESAWSAARALTIQAAGPAPGAPVASPPFTDTMEAGGSSWINDGDWALVNTAEPHPGRPVELAICSGDRQLRQRRSQRRLRSHRRRSACRLGLPNTCVSGITITLKALKSIGTSAGCRSPSTAAPSSTWHSFPAIRSTTGCKARLSRWQPTPARPCACASTFTTLDRALNNYLGWFIDDVSITPEPPPACTDADNDPAQATLITYGGTASGKICPSGDLDYYVFHGSGGRPDRAVDGSPGAWLAARYAISPCWIRMAVRCWKATMIRYNMSGPTRGYRYTAQAQRRLLRPGAGRGIPHPRAAEAYNYTLHLVQENQNPIGMFVSPDPSGFFQHAAHRERLCHGWAERRQPCALLLARIGLAKLGVGDAGRRLEWERRLELRRRYLDLGRYLRRSRSTLRFIDRAGNWFGAGLWNVKGAPTYLPLIIRSR